MKTWSKLRLKNIFQLQRLVPEYHETKIKFGDNSSIDDNEQLLAIYIHNCKTYCLNTSNLKSRTKDLRDS